jgi:hypothetical protein
MNRRVDDDGRLRALAAVAALYAAQGLVYGYASYVLIPTLAASGVSLEAQTGVLALAGAPWVLKLLWAPLVDSRVASHRPLAVARVGSFVAGACLVAAAWVGDPADHVVGLATLWLLANVALSLLDVATDAFTLDAFAPGARGVANGAMLGGREIGTHALGGLALGTVVGASGAVGGLVVLGIGCAALGAVTWIVRVRPRSQPTDLRPAVAWELLLRPRSLVLGLVAAGALVADVGTSAVAGDFLVTRLRWAPERIYSELPIWLSLGSLLGYGAAALAVDRLRAGRASVVGACGLAAVWLGFAAAESWWTTEGVLQAMVVVQALPTALLYAGLYAWLMDATDPRVRATHFAVLMALLNLPRVFAPPAMAAAVTMHGYAGAFGLAGLLQAVAAVVLLVAVRRPAPDQR